MLRTVHFIYEADNIIILSSRKTNVEAADAKIESQKEFTGENSHLERIHKGIQFQSEKSQITF